MVIFSQTEIDEVVAVVGEHDLSKDGDEQAYHKLKNVIIHEQFNYLTFEHDFAILKLEKPVKVTSKVTTVWLPSETTDVLQLTGKNGTVYGWGLNENDTQLPILKEINMEILSNNVCQNTFELGKAVISNLTDNQICALSKTKGSATCFGDSGGEAAIQK
jgi:secreted trypsin-like serine protease